MNYERKDCRLCGAKVETVLTLTPTPLANLFPTAKMTGDVYPLELKECSNCRHVQIGYVVDDSVLYGDSYKYSTPTALKPQLMERAMELRQQYPYARNVVEIGSNNGMFLHALKDAGFPSVIGIDPSATDPLSWRMPFNSDTARLIVNRVGEIDLIVANNVFAHVDDLREVFNGIDLLLSYRGALVFEVQYLMGLIRTGAFDMVYHEHRDYHSLEPLALFLRSWAMVMTWYEEFEAHGGSIRVTAMRSGRQVVLPQENYDWQEFEKRIAAEKKYILDQIAEPIPAFGAAAKAVTLIHHFGLQDKITYCVDDTPQKQGTFIAGTNIPVVSRGMIEKERPKKMLLLSWNYASLIEPMFKDIEFIVPFSQRDKFAAPSLQEKCNVSQ